LLHILIEELRYDAAFSETAQRLIANQTVRQDQELLRAVTRWAQHYPGVYREACRLYLARWPPGKELPMRMGNSPNIG